MVVNELYNILKLFDIQAVVRLIHWYIPSKKIVGI